MIETADAIGRPRGIHWFPIFDSLLFFFLRWFVCVCPKSTDTAEQTFFFFFVFDHLLVGSVAAGKTKKQMALTAASNAMKDDRCAAQVDGRFRSLSTPFLRCRAAGYGRCIMVNGMNGRGGNR